jgi:O-antigen/teichoic acid export membrane protein
LRADYTFRAVALGAGEWEVVFRYSPLSLRVGLLASMLSFVILLLLGATSVWGRLYREDEEAAAGTMRRVAKNSLLPMMANLVGRLIDLGFAIIVVRTLGPEGQGRYTLAIVFIGYFDILTNFGLNVLLTREVARDRSKANYYLSNTVALRLLLWLISLPFIAAYIYVMKLPWDTAAAIALFALGLVPSNLAAALSSVFYAYEKMEYPAAVTIITTVSRVALGTTVLLAGWGIAGLAGSSVVVNTGTALLLFYPLYTRFFRPRPEIDGKAGRAMLVESYPLMINHFLATIFFRIDTLLMKPMLGAQADAAIGYYGTAYKFIDGLNIIPSYLTMAIFPLMSRYAQEASDALRRAYVLSLRLLLLLALPLSTGIFLLADRIILLFFGEKMLPGSGQALALLIWFLPFSFINSVTQYALIAVNQQRFLTRAFIIGATFNVVANLLLIPRYSFVGAAVTTVLSELVLFLPFYYSVRRHITPLPFLELFWRPIVASAVMGSVIWLARGQPLLLIVLIAMVAYAVALLAFGAVTKEDRDLARRVRGR